jgi:cytidylate kinase
MRYIRHTYSIAVKARINIAIDGFSSCGKSTLAKAIASQLNYLYIDSGAMYRAVALFALKHQVVRNGELNHERIVTLLDALFIAFKFNTDSGRFETWLNGKNVEKEIRTMQVSNAVSLVASVPEVRKKLVKLQQRMAEQRGVVMDGRDIGTVVMPDAEVKIFMTASPEVRAKRRYDELIEKGQEVTYDEVLDNVRMRDHIDSTRAADPLRAAEDAIIVDNSALTIDEQFIFVMGHIHKHLQVPAN